MDRNTIFENLAVFAFDQDSLYRELRKLPIDVVADVLHHVPPEYPALREALPSMAAEEVQISWTGSCGYPLLMQSCAFVRAIECGINRFARKSIDGMRMLDYGCGWGRIIRLMYKFTDPSNIYGCDPWDQSIAICKANRINAHLGQSDYLPTSLPFNVDNFDLIYAFSVFTHLSERAANAALFACRKSISEDGVMVITVRPRSYWAYHNSARNEVDIQDMQEKHDTYGFAFTPHARAAVDGDITYGDTSISLRHIEDRWAEWKIMGTDVCLQDPYQTLVFLKPR